MLNRFINSSTQKKSKKVFILGVGAQRTGSTWLYSQLFKTPKIAKGLCKEYHFLDTLFASNKLKKDSQHTHVVAEKKKSFHQDFEHRASMINQFVDNPDEYFIHFNNLFNSKQAAEAVGEITPSYSMLDAEAFNFIRSGLENHGFTVKVIFIMRDPVERVWSMLHQKSKVIASEKTGTPIYERQHSLENFIGEGASIRTQYHRTITELEKAFKPENIFYEFYERMMTPASYKKLENFLEIKLLEPDYKFIKNSSYKKKTIDDKLARQVAIYYRDTYLSIDKRFNKETRAVWPGYKYIN